MTRIVADLCRGQRSAGDEAAFLLRKNVARFAQRPADDDFLRRPRGAGAVGRADRHRMIGAVQNRPGQVVEAGVEQIERVLAHRLDRANLADEIAAFGDEEPARFDLQRNLVAELRGQPVPRRIPQFEVGREVDELLTFAIRNRQTAAGADRE